MFDGRLHIDDDSVSRAMESLGGAAVVGGVVLLRFRRYFFKLKIVFMAVLLAIPLAIGMFYVTSSATK